ncbi:hypothetical protein ASPFODRAFT_38498 [Aspergillus luchuensis CBS 106.47]|uniref:Uncharacterized protein n=1 Tax=Aspergillus luchuensis (strain CBS 106.47) TaxID=1137211 RepID=A0A1M3SZI1_ASPLC|nr:hypothetical protein ASPFODRAFT_38498 [Aspergillus luchuensis CBS 106.47]
MKTVNSKKTSQHAVQDDPLEDLVYQAAVQSQAALSTARRLVDISDILIRNVSDPSDQARLSAQFGRCVMNINSGLLFRIAWSKSRGISGGKTAQGKYYCYDSMLYVTDFNNPDGERERRIMGSRDVTDKIDEMEEETCKRSSLRFLEVEFNST